MTPIVVNGRFLTGRTTGLQRTARSFVHALRRNGVDVEVVAPRGTDDPLVDRDAGRPGRTRGRFTDHVWEQVSLPVRARGSILLSLANTAPLAAGRSAVVVHDLAPIAGPGWFVPSMRAYGALVVLAARRSDLVVTVSNAVKSELVDRGVPDDRIVVVPPAVDEVFRPASRGDVEEVRRRYGVEAEPYLLFVGWTDPRKDLATALAAHRAARATHPHRLVLVGSPHPAFRAVARPPDAIVAGPVDDGDLVALLSGATALLYPSRYEGFGLPPLEAWACGTPALVADIPVLREATAGNATYVPPGAPGAWRDAIVEALDGGLPVPARPTRTWDDAGNELATALGRLG